MLSRKTRTAYLILALLPLLAWGSLQAQTVVTSGAGSVTQGSSGAPWTNISGLTLSATSGGQTNASLGGASGVGPSSSVNASPASNSLTSSASNGASQSQSLVSEFSGGSVSGNVVLSFQTSASFSGSGSGGTVTVNYSTNSGSSWTSAYGTTSSTGTISSSLSISGVSTLSKLWVQLVVVAGSGSGTTATVQGTIQSILATYTPVIPSEPAASATLTASSLGLSLPSGAAITAISANLVGWYSGSQVTLQVQFTAGGTNIGSAQSIVMGSGYGTSYQLTGLQGVHLTAAQASSLAVNLVASVGSTAVSAVVYLSGLSITLTDYALSATVQITGSEQKVNSADAWDAGIVSVSINGFSKSAPYGQGSTPASVASALAAYFSRDCNTVASAMANSSGMISLYLLHGTALNQLSVTEQSIFGEQSISFGASYTGDSSQPPSTPSITDMSPAQGIVGTTVTLTGTNFGTSPGTLFFGPTSISPSTWSSTSIVFNVPSGATSSAVTVSTTAGDTSSPIFVVLNDLKTVDVYGYALTYALNGNVLSVSDEVNGNWSYSYDNLNRLYTAVPGSGAASGYAGHSLCMYYDDFGNRTEAQWQTAACSAPPAAGKPAPNPTATYNSANQVTNNFYQYDLSGDVIYDGANWYAYDNEGRLCAVQSGVSSATGYLYDADGRRVAKGSITPSTSTPLPSSMCNAATNGFAVTESYVLSQASEQLTTYTWSGSQSTWARTNVYGADGLLATYDTVGAGLHFHLTDHLGTRRVQTDPTGTPETDCQSLPYGDSQYCFAAPGSAATGASDDDATPLHFTGKQRDVESGNDYFEARYYASNAGRFMSPDWTATVEPVPYARMDSPQSLNLYAYVGNNPLGSADPDGHRQPNLTDRFGCSDGEYCDGNSGQPYDSLTAAVRDAAAIGGTPFDGAMEFLGALYSANQAQQQNTNSAPAHFEYSISTGEIWKVDASGNATFVSSGYSGKGNGLNNPFDQDVEGKKDKPDAGPIPAGTYTIGKMFDNKGKTGPGSMRLTPDAGNEMNGRSGFLIHGDNSKHNFSASEGCVILPSSARNAISSSGITRLEVNANIW